MAQFFPNRTSLAHLRSLAGPPHLFTLLFLVLFYAALEQVKEGRTHLMGVPILGVLPVATVLWTNLHGGFFVGSLMILAYGGGEMLQLVFHLTPKTGVRHGSRRATIFSAAWRAWPPA